MNKIQGCLMGLRALLVDDNPDCSLMTKLLLIRTGVLVDTADNGEDGVKLALADTFDLVMMDMQMPNISGAMAIRALRAYGYGGSILACSAHAFSHHVTEAIEAGANGYLVKPFGFSELITAIEKVTKKGTATWQVPNGDSLVVTDV